MFDIEAEGQYEQTGVWLHTFWTGLSRYNHSFFVDEDSNLLEQYKCNSEISNDIMKHVNEEQLTSEEEWKMQFPSEMTAILVEEKAVGNSTSTKVVWKNTKPGKFRTIK